MLLSVVIPARNEFPNIVFTIHSILSVWESDGFSPKDIEIIIVDNCSNDDFFPQRGTRGTTSYLEGRGAYYNRFIRVLRDPIAGNHSARNKGAAIALGKYLYFSDAHMSLAPGFFKNILKAVDESGGLVHGSLQFLGAYPPSDSGMGYQYTIKLGEEIKGTWNNRKVSDNWFYIAAQGHWGLACRRDQFLEFGGYPRVHRCYGGGEFYTDMKWWLFGSTVAVEPKAIGYHLASGRNYSYNHTDYVENVLGIAYALGMDDWRERMYINQLRKHDKKELDTVMARNEKEYATERLFVEYKRIKTFNELIVELPWNKLNEAKHGYSNFGLQILHDTILPLFKEVPQAWKAYEEGKYQKDLEIFINEKLSEYVYKR